jgi:hypothetical protein
MTPSGFFCDCRISPVLPLPSTTRLRREGSARKEKPAGAPAGLVRKPPLFRERVAHRLMGLSPSCPEAGLRQVLSDGLPKRRFATGRFHVLQYERPDVIKGPKDTRACGSARIHPYRFEIKFAH